MIVIDTSALVAILLDEPERQRFNRVIESATNAYVTATTVLETRIILVYRVGEIAVSDLDEFILKSRITVAAITPQIADIAFEAYQRFGKGSGHGASLNFGDCLSYALAKKMDIPLLFKGNDFAKTDIRSAAD